MKKRKTAKAVKQQTVSYKKKRKAPKEGSKAEEAMDRRQGVGKVGQRARLAETLEGMHKKKAAKKQAWMKKVGGKPC